MVIVICIPDVELRRFWPIAVMSSRVVHAFLVASARWYEVSQSYLTGAEIVDTRERSSADGVNAPFARQRESEILGTPAVVFRLMPLAIWAV